MQVTGCGYLRVYIKEHENDILCDGSSAVLSITPEWTVHDVVCAVAKRRCLECQDYQLVINNINESTGECYETTLNQSEYPIYYQRKAVEAGQLNRLRFVLQKVSEEKNSEDDNDNDNDNNHHHQLNCPSFLAQSMDPQNGQEEKEEGSKMKYPSGYLEIKSAYKMWKRRYFVLIDDKLFCYKCHDSHVPGIDNLAYILVTNPTVNVQILWNKSSTNSKNSSDSSNNKKPNWWYFNIHVSTKVYSLRTDNYDTLMKWINIFWKKDETEELLEELDHLIAKTEKKNADADEQRMEAHNVLDNVLLDRDLSDAYLDFLQGRKCDEFWYFWQDWHNFHSTWDERTSEKRKKLADELYAKYIKPGTNLELSELRREQKVEVKYLLDTNNVTQNMFDNIQRTVYGYLERNLYDFLQSVEYFRCLVYKERTLNGENTYEWPSSFRDQTPENELCDTNISSS